MEVVEVEENVDTLLQEREKTEYYRSIFDKVFINRPSAILLFIGSATFVRPNRS